MKNFFSFLAKLVAFLLVLSAIFVGVGYFLNKKTMFFRNLFSKKGGADAEE